LKKIKMQRNMRNMKNTHDAKAARDGHLEENVDVADENAEEIDLGVKHV